MAWGVLDDPHMAMPPGTVNLKDSGGFDEGKDLKKSGGIILQPQPSDSPNDPLNWSKLRKYSYIAVIILGSALTAAIAQFLTPGLPLIAKQYAVSVDLASSLLAVSTTFWTSVAAVLSSSGGNVWGRRPFYVIAVVLLFVAHVLSFSAKSFVFLAILRAVAGFASGPLYTAVTATITDMFYVHERGLILSVWTVSLTAGGSLGPVISGFVIEAVGVAPLFAYAAIAYAILVPLTYFGCMETLYTRSDPGNVECKLGKADAESDYDLKVFEKEPKQTYGRQLAIFRGRLTDESFWRGILKVFVLIFLPTNFCATILFTAFFGLVPLLSILSATSFSLPPYNLSPFQVGLTNLPVLIAALFSATIAGWVSDASIKSMAARNKNFPGRYEPEFRLTLIIIAAPICTVSLIGFALSIQQGVILAWPVTWMSLFTFGSTFATQAAVTYVIDCNPTLAASAFAGLNLIAAIVVFLLSTHLTGWFITAGPVFVMGVAGAVIAVISLMTIPQYIFGKRIRSNFARSNIGRHM